MTYGFLRVLEKIDTELEKDPDLMIVPQPNDITCGPTCLYALYRYYDRDVSLNHVIDEVIQLEGGGTLGVLLGQHALENGFDATIITYNLEIFDPSWFTNNASLIDKLEEQMQKKQTDRIQYASKAYLNFLKKGGKITTGVLTADLIGSYLRRQQPILTGLSATFLYQTAREISETNQYDDIIGEPAGHFVVIKGFNASSSSILIADPLKPNPISVGQYYEVDIYRLINAILLGIMTYDANLLIIEPKKTNE